MTGEVMKEGDNLTIVFAPWNFLTDRQMMSQSV